MSEKYIRQNKKSCVVVKSSKTFAKTDNLEDAIFIRDFLVDINWDLTKVPEILKYNQTYLVLTIYEEKIFILAKYGQKPSKETIDKLVKKHKRNPNNSKYGLNISRIIDTYVITKQIAGDSYVFGLYDNLKDAEFVRNFLMDHQWNVNEFDSIEYDEELDNYKAILVIDDYVYVLDSFESDDIDLNKVYEEFLAKISKHKYGLDNFPHLDSLKNKIHELEEELNVKAHDDVWMFGDAMDEKDALSEIIFNLTPFQKSIYDAIGKKATFDEIKQKLIRFNSGNFEEKINNNLEELIEKYLIKKDGDYYIIC